MHFMSDYPHQLYITYRVALTWIDHVVVVLLAVYENFYCARNDGRRATTPHLQRHREEQRSKSDP